MTESESNVAMYQTRNWRTKRWVECDKDTYDQFNAYFKEYGWVDGESPVRKLYTRDVDLEARIENALSYLHDYLDSGSLCAPDWAIEMAAILTGANLMRDKE